MAHKRLKTEDMEVDYKFTCRCCLKSEAEFFKLDSLTECLHGENDASSNTKMPLIRLLLFCMRTENMAELPQYICVECSKSLQIAYFFIQNALRAHEILCRKLCPGKLKNKTRLNGHYQLNAPTERQDASLVPHQAKNRKAAVRHECKVCGEIIYNRLELKQHIRLHTDGKMHKCKLCDFITLKHRQLPEHYRRAHGLTATQIEQQLKIRRSMQAAAAATNATTTNAAAVDDGQVKVCTLEDMELLIPTVLTPEDFTHPQYDADQLRAIEEQLANSMCSTLSGSAAADASSTFMPAETTLAASGSNNMSIGAEFLVLPDGTLQQVNDAGVVFEYIDDSKSTSTPSNMNLQSLLGDSNPNLTYDAVDTDMQALVVQNALPQITVKPKLRPSPASTAALKHRCKLCSKAFPTVARLKSHQLTHSHLPKFYCDQCAYYSLRSADLIQHYTAEHNSIVGDNQMNLLDRSPIPLPADRSRTFSCDMCLFETPSSGQLRVHYSDKHLMQPNDVQLRPSWSNESTSKGSSSTPTRGTNELKDLKPVMPDIPMGIQYPTMTSAATDTASTTMELPQQPPQATTTAVVTPTGEINVVVDATSLFYAATAGGISTTEATAITTKTTTTTAGAKDANAFAMFPEQSFVNSLTTTTPTKTGTQNGMLPAAVSTAATSENPNTSIFGDMQEFIDNTDVAAICTIPADDMPVVDGDDIVIDNNNMSLDFDAENLFEEFEEDVVDEDEDDEDEDDDEEDAENDDENDNNDAAADQHLLLTSDDDDVDDFDDEQSKHLQKPYCIYCNKKFTSQYKFENHMFVHRGLAPYRCELCTNLYNMKRLLIRHYKTVHKRLPTRDMVQAKGDKVSVPCTAIEKLNFNLDKPPMQMCAKCPFECDHESDMRKHLNAHHGINDGLSVHANEVFIIRKLPFECPRCIRSFAAKRTLTRHLQRSHLVDTIIEMQAPHLTTSSAVTTATLTATTALLKNDNDADGSDFNTTTSQPDSMMAISDQKNAGTGTSDVKCETSIYQDTGVKMEVADIDSKPVTPGTTTETQVLNAATNETTATTTATPAERTSATLSTTAATSALTTSAATSSATTAATSVVSSLFPTPASFDFDFDFIGSGAHATPIKNDSFHITPSPIHLLNGTDKLLTAALEPSPIKDIRSHLPRTPIFVCKQCNQTFDELGKLLQHELEQHSSGVVSPASCYQHQCKICHTSYRTVTLLNYHMKRHATARKIDCKMCPKQFTVNSELETHVQVEHRGRVFLKCGMDGCKKTFNYKHHLKRHQTASHMPAAYICPECGREMLTSLQLRNHISSHKGTHSYKCPKCVRIYLRRNPFRRHALREHKWDLTDEEINKIYSANDQLSTTIAPQKKRGRKPKKLKEVKVEQAD